MGYGSGLTRGAQMLTHRGIEALRPAEAPYRVPDQRRKGLAVRVAPSGVKTWDLAYRIRGTARHAACRWGEPPTLAWSRLVRGRTNSPARRAAATT
jgi:hypothetical protein